MLIAISLYKDYLFLLNVTHLLVSRYQHLHHFFATQLFNPHLTRHLH